MIKSRILIILKYLFFIILGVFLIWVTTRSLTSEEINQVKKLILGAENKIIIPSMFIVMISHYLRALRWKMMIIPLNHHPKTLNVYFSVLIGFFFNLVFPRLGEVMKCTLLGKHEKIPVDKLVGTVVSERVIDVICLLIVISLTIFTQFNVVGNYALEISSKFVANISNDKNKIIISLLVFVLLIAFVIWLFKKMSSFKLVIKIKELFKGILLGVVSIKDIKNKPLFIIYTILIWFFYLYSIKFGFLALKELVDLGWIPSLTILTFGSFAMIATQGGIGAYQLAVQKTLSLYGISQVGGLAFGWLIWSVQTILLLVFGPLSLLLMGILNKKKLSPDEPK